MKKLYSLVLLLFTLTISFSCRKYASIEEEIPISERVVAAPDGFTFATSRKVDINLRLLTNTNTPIRGVVVSLLKPGTSEEKDGVFFKAASDINGYIKGSVLVPSYLDTLIINPDYPGLMNHAKGLITSDVLSAVIGGSNGYSGSIIQEFPTPDKAGSANSVLFDFTSADVDVAYPSPYTATANAVKSPLNLGVPKFLESTRDDIDQQTLEFIAATFPEGSTDNVLSKHPEYLTSTITSVAITKTSSLYVTFVSEGASNTNSLAYYTYNTSNPPDKEKDLDRLTLMFPNASANGSGGGLVTGDKVRIGPFNAGTSVGFVLLQDAWSGSGVYTSTQKFYTNSELNPESSNSARRHSFLLYDDAHQFFLVGFEELNRQSASSNPGRASADNDFNDLLFYVTPAEAISSTGVSAITIVTDQDNDGVSDTADEFPADPLRAYTETSTWNTLAFEDLWPNTGDYDMNDVVVQHRYRYIKNADNNILEFYGEYKVQAAGALYNDGFGVEFPFAPGLVKSVTGQRRMHANYIIQAANGLEAGQTKAVIVPFDDYHAVIPNSSNTDPAINTKPNLPKVEGELLSIKVEFNSPVSAATVGATQFNPFLIGNQVRGFEVHLPGKGPTDKGDKNLFGTGHDKTNILTGKFYQTVNNWPFAINIAGTFQHPTEGSAISTSYLYFLTWAQSGGLLFPDWYSNTGTGYRLTDKLFIK